MDPMSLISSVILGLSINGLASVWLRLIGLSAESLSKDYRDDPVYK